MDKASKYLKTATLMKEISMKVNSMEKASSLIDMVQFMKGCLLMVRFKDLGAILQEAKLNI